MRVWIAAAIFNPPWWAVAINPAFLPRRALWSAMVSAAPLASGRLLDIGCGTKPYRSLFAFVSEYVGLELDTPANRCDKKADLFYAGDSFPLADAGFDVVLCNQVLEHVFQPDVFIREIHRVLRSDGLLILTVPCIWPEHEQPHDCLRYTSFGIRDRLVRAGFSIVTQRKLTTGIPVLFALAGDRINTLFSSSHWIVKLFARCLLIAPLSLIGWLLSIKSNPDSELYLDNFLVCRKSVDDWPTDEALTRK